MLGLSQVLSTSLVDDVKSMLISKYGQPKDTLDYDFNSFFILEGNQVNSYKGTDKIKGKVYSWETEFLDIKIFEGILNVGTTYVSETKSYLKPIFPHDLSIQTPKTALSPGETHCFSYPYIQYKLNENAIKLLKLDVPNL